MSYKSITFKNTIMKSYFQNDLNEKKKSKTIKIDQNDEDKSFDLIEKNSEMISHDSTINFDSIINFIFAQNQSKKNHDQSRKISIN